MNWQPLLSKEYQIDVAVAGGGIAGVFAAIAAAKKGGPVFVPDQQGIQKTPDNNYAQLPMSLYFVLRNTHRKVEPYLPKG
ncbi:MAG: FAD-binding protein [Actinobacteria bacterium]|nr:FAD-binding protein [Actinomycetota bacterium]